MKTKTVIKRGTFCSACRREVRRGVEYRTVRGRLVAACCRGRWSR